MATTDREPAARSRKHLWLIWWDRFEERIVPFPKLAGQRAKIR